MKRLPNETQQELKRRRKKAKFDLKQKLEGVTIWDSRIKGTYIRLKRKQH